MTLSILALTPPAPSSAPSSSHTPSTQTPPKFCFVASLSAQCDAFRIWACSPSFFRHASGRGIENIPDFMNCRCVCTCDWKVVIFKSTAGARPTFVCALILESGMQSGNVSCIRSTHVDDGRAGEGCGGDDRARHDGICSVCICSLWCAKFSDGKLF